MEDLLGRLLDSDTLFFLFDALHQLLSISILARHDVADTEVGQHNGGDGKKIVHLTANEWLIVANSVTVLVVLHKEDVGNVELPSLVLRAELCGLAEDLLHHRVVVLVPVDLGLHHEDGDVLVEGQIVLLKGMVDGLRVTGDPSILDRLSLLAERINMLVGKLLKFAEGLLLRGLV